METNSIESMYLKYLEMPGDAVTRMRLLGYPVDSTKCTEINSEDDFRKVVSEIDYYSKDELKIVLKAVFSNYIKIDELSSFLKMGKEGFNEKELAEALRIIPINEDGTISVEGLIEYLDK